MAEALSTTAARLASPPPGTSEATIQSDIRKFLLDAPLELVDESVLEIVLESPAGQRRRIDVEAGCAVIEVKRALTAGKVYDEAVVQLAGYVAHRTEETGLRYVGVLSDGRRWELHLLDPTGQLQVVSAVELRSGEDAPALTAWLDAILATVQQVAATPREIVRRLGAGSPAFLLARADLGALYEACRDDPELQLKRELWARLLSAALGTNFTDSDELFIEHTYLVLTAELLAHALLGIDPSDPGLEPLDLLEGKVFGDAGLHGVVEPDFFDWPAQRPEGGRIVRGIARRLAAFDWSKVERDVLKALYESVIDSETRHQLGEYYTPDWLAEKTVAATFSAPLDQRVLDPACGSGTFLFWAVRATLAACEAAGVHGAAALEEVARRVHGIDLHPVAVTLARVTYLMAIGPARLQAERGEIDVPVYLGDSVRWDQDDNALTSGGIRVYTTDGLELFHQELFFPDQVVGDAGRFDRLVADLTDTAAARPRGDKPRPIKMLLNRHKVAEGDREAIETVYKQLCGLHDQGRNHIWGYYIRNLARPLSYTRPGGRVDVLVGNPPWLAYRHMPPEIQTRYEAMASARRLWAGGKVATHQDLSDLFVARACEQYLQPTGRFAFVMPFAVLSRRQYQGFRSGDWTPTNGADVTVAFDQPEEFSTVKPPLFPVPSCVIAGTRAKTPVGLGASTRHWSGHVSDHHEDWATALAELTVTDVAIQTGQSAEAYGGSAYRGRFTQGASLVPRVLLTVRPAVPNSPLGQVAGRIRVASLRSANEKQPWKSLPTLEGQIENQFVRPTHFGSTNVAHRVREPIWTVIPEIGGEILEGASPTLDLYPGLATWWRTAETTWLKNRSKASGLSLKDQIDFQGKLRKQFPIPPLRVVYTKSGQHLAACIVEDPHAVIDHKLYWAAVDSLEEGRYLTAILNSVTLAELVTPLQARGQHNPRDFDLHVFGIPFPIYDGDQELHRTLAAHAAVAEDVAGAIDLHSVGQFQKARRLVREVLREHGVAAQIDALVEELVAVSVNVPTRS